MSEYSKFGQWGEGVATWNVSTGCTKISAGCDNCYAETLALRNQGRRNVDHSFYENGFELKLQENRLSEPRSYKSPRLVFVNSMSDLFHENIPFEYIRTVFETMNQFEQHTFAFMTKRSERLLELSPRLLFSPNIRAGVTVENGDYISRIENLRRTNARIKFVSFEPLLSSIRGLNLTGIHWAIIGGETGVRARPMNPAWATEIISVCHRYGVQVYFKGYGRWAPLRNIVSASYRNRILEQNRGNIQVNHTPIRYHDFPNGARAFKLKGVKQANRLIEGIEWNEMPSISNIPLFERSTQEQSIEDIRRMSNIPMETTDSDSENDSDGSDEVAEIRRNASRRQGN